MTNTDSQQLSTLAAAESASTAVGGAPPENRNRMRHGLRSTRWPDGCERDQRDTQVVRRSLEDAVFDLRGEVSVHDALLINEVVEWERVRRLAGRWLRMDFENLSAADRLSYCRESARAASARNKAIEALGLEAESVGVDKRIPLLPASQPLLMEGPTQ
jgi:hypothetical protein